MDSPREITPKPNKEVEPKPAELEPSQEALSQREAAEAPSVLVSQPGLAIPLAEEAVPSSSRDKDLLERGIESVLEEDLQEIFWTLPADQQVTFKIQSENTASKIHQLLQQATVKTQEIFNLIVNWLKTLPGINIFFIEQEAKIKTDKIMKLKQ